MFGFLPLYLVLAPADPSYQQASAELDELLDQVVTEQVEVAEVTQAIERAIERIGDHPDELAADTEVADRLTKARLTLVWLYLFDADEAAATATMDDAIRSAGGQALPAGKFGPAVLRLYEARVEALEAQGKATLAVDCGRRPCIVLVDERPATNPSEPLYLGAHRVWIGARQGDPAWERFEVELREPGASERITYRAGVERATDDRSNGSGRPRMLPRWVEIVGLSAGAGLLVAGAVLHALDGRCVNRERSSDAWICPHVYQTSAPAAYALLGSGSGLLVLSGVMLTIDEVRVGGREGRQATLTWSFRF